jgi:hypothetical protein
MAATTGWKNADLAAGKIGQASKVSGGKLLCLAGVVAKAAADGDGSVIYLAKLPANAIPVKCELNNDALAGCTSVDLGLYKENGVVANKALLMSAVDINGGKAIGSEQSGLAAVAIADLGKKLYELLGLTAANKVEEAYLLALTLNTAGAAAGNIAYRFYYILG